MSEYREKHQFSLPCCLQLFHFTVKFTDNNCKDGAGIINLRHVGHNWHTSEESGAWASLALVSAAWSSDARNVTMTRSERKNQSGHLLLLFICSDTRSPPFICKTNVFLIKYKSSFTVKVRDSHDSFSLFLHTSKVAILLWNSSLNIYAAAHLCCRRL